MCFVCDRMDKEYFANAKEGDLRVWWVPQVPMRPFHYPVQTIQEAKKMLDILASYDAFQFEHNVKPDYWNIGGLQVFEDCEWIDWESEDGDDIDSV